MVKWWRESVISMPQQTAFGIYRSITVRICGHVFWVVSGAGQTYWHVPNVRHGWWSRVHLIISHRSVAWLCNFWFEWNSRHVNIKFEKMELFTGHAQNNIHIWEQTVAGAIPVWLSILGSLLMINPHKSYMWHFGRQTHHQQLDSNSFGWPTLSLYGLKYSKVLFLLIEIFVKSHSCWFTSITEFAQILRVFVG